jgi:23S rRNA pseudouridine1911/1915/1917 synthase
LVDVTDPSAERFSWIVAAEAAGLRLDHYLVQRNVLGTRSQIQQLIQAALVKVNGRPVKAGMLLRPGQRIDVRRPAAQSRTMVAQDIPLSILYEDAHLMVINKPAGLVVHPAPGHWDGTLVNALLHRWRESSAEIDLARLGLVHRLDKDTSGALLIAKDAETLERLSQQFRGREVRKEYLALVRGRLRQRKGTLSGAIARHPVHRQRMAVRTGGRHAVTHYEVVEEFGSASLLRCFPETGRTHQIRVHLSTAGHPILGDRQYGAERSATPFIQRQALHAATITFRHPATQEAMSVVAPLPDDLRTAIEALRQKNRA